LPRRQGLTAGVADFHDVAGLGEFEEPDGVVGVEVQTAVGDVGVALGPDRGIELMEIDPVGADPGGVLDGFAVAQPGVDGQPKRSRSP
jgi:hypothetical protein